MSLKNNGEIYDESVSWTIAKYIRDFFYEWKNKHDSNIITKNISNRITILSSVRETQYHTTWSNSSGSKVLFR